MAPTFFCYSCNCIVSAQELPDGNFMCNQCHGNFIEIRDEPEPQPATGPQPLPFPNFLFGPANIQPTSVVRNENGSITYTFTNTGPSQGRVGTNILNSILGQLFMNANPQFNNGDYFMGDMDQLLNFLMQHDPNHYGPPPTSGDYIRNMVHRHPTASELASSPECAVCESDLTKDDTIVCLPCKHLFHPNCIIPWIKQHNTCPVCRSSLPEMVSSDDRYEDDEENGEGEGVEQHL